MIPPTLGPACRSNAERRVFEWLSHVQLGPGSRAYHSLNLPEHQRKREGEADFLILTPRGYLVLEVKGGGVSCSDGRWTYTDRNGTRHDGREGPFKQAQSALYALRGRLEKQLGRDALRGTVHGYGVVTPDTELPPSEEWVPAQLCDGSNRGVAGMRNFLEGLFDHWATAAPGTKTPVDRATLEAIARFVRPDFDRAPMLGAWADDLTHECVRLNELQLGALDVLETAHRAVVTGGAGTGKTFLAAEIARRQARAGVETLFVTHSRTLAAFLRGELTGEGVEILSFEQAVKRQAHAGFLVIDEAQDLVNHEALLAIDGLVDGGLADGRWAVFLDSNNQANVAGTFDPEAFKELQSYASVAPRFRKNLRNTEQIIDRTRDLTGADIGLPVLSAGPAVQTPSIKPGRDQGAELGAWIRRLEQDGVAPGRITVLSLEPLERSAAGRMGRELTSGLTVVTPETVSRWPRSDLTFSRISDFKGMENEFVAVVDAEAGLFEDEHRAELYVALTRARVGLWIAVPEECRSAFDRLLSRFMGAEAR